MQFRIGQIAIHPFHGPGDIVDVVTRTVRGKEIDYLKLVIRGGNLVIGIPVDKAAEIGLRNVADQDQIDALFATLQAKTAPEEVSWSRRFKANQERLATGEPLIVATVVRDLTRRSHTVGLSMGERDMLRDARGPIVAELALALGICEDDASETLDAHILSEQVAQSA